METIVIDGGPCSGKTTGLATLCEKLFELGFLPVIVPESATIMIQSGVSIPMIGPDEFERRLISLQLHNEQFFKEAARIAADRQGRRPILICDRGLLTPAAYTSGNGSLGYYQEHFLQPVGQTIESIRSRYTGIIHMVTAADGAEEFYTTANNSARTETPDEARELDRRTQAVWVGHPNLVRVGNRDQLGNPISFEQKIQAVITAALRVLRYPTPMESMDVHDLRSFDPNLLPVSYELIHITETPLRPDANVMNELLRIRESHGEKLHIHVTVDARGDREEVVSESTYTYLAARADHDQAARHIDRYCFIWEGQYFTVDHEVDRDVWNVVRQKTFENQGKSLPPFLDLI